MKHANFIINHGSASAADIEESIRHVQRTVAQRDHVDLSTEVRIVGEAQNQPAQDRRRHVLRRVGSRVRQGRGAARLGLTMDSAMTTPKLQHELKENGPSRKRS